MKSLLSAAQSCSPCKITALQDFSIEQEQPEGGDTCAVGLIREEAATGGRKYKLQLVELRLRHLEQEGRIRQHPVEMEGGRWKLSRKTWLIIKEIYILFPYKTIANHFLGRVSWALGGRWWYWSLVEHPWRRFAFKKELNDTWCCCLRKCGFAFAVCRCVSQRRGGFQHFNLCCCQSAGGLKSLPAEGLPGEKNKLRNKSR